MAAAGTLRDLQEAFTRGVYDGDEAVLEQIANTDAAARLAIHRNNTLGSLRRVLASHFPAVEAFLGEATFTAASRAFVRDHPPEAPQLLDFGATFPDFLARSAAAESFPWLVDLARLEWARNEAYHGDDAAPMQPQSLTSLRPEQFAGVRFVLHPTAALIASDHPVHALWQTILDGGEVDAAFAGEAETVLVVRPQMQVATVRLAPAEARWLQKISDGATLGEAVSAAGDSLDLQSTLAAHLQRGTFIRFDVES